MKRRAGQGMVELALVLPLFLVMVCGLIDFARVYNAQETLHRVAKEAVNTGSQVKADGTRPTTAEVNAILLSSVLPPLVPAGVVVNSVDAARVDASGRRSVYVSLSYNVPLITPFIGRFFPQATTRLDSAAELPYPYAKVVPPAQPPLFTLDSSGNLVATGAASAAIQVLGKQLTYGAGGPAIPVTMSMNVAKSNGGSGSSNFSPIFGGNGVNGGEEMNVSLKKGDELELDGTANYTQNGTTLFNATYQSDNPQPFADNANAYHTVVLRNGDAAPTTAGYDGQKGVATYLAPYEDPSTGTMKLGPNDAIILWEFNPAYNSPAADYNDLVVLVSFS